MRNTFLRTVAGAFEGLHPVLIPLFALFCGCCVRGFYLYDLSLLPVGSVIVGPDVSEYYSWACRILAGEYLTETVPIHAPLYAYFLALLSAFCDHQVLEMRFLQSILMMCFTVFPVYYSLRVIYFAPENQTLDRPWTMRFIPFISTFLVALYPPLVIYQTDFYAENLVCIFLAFSIYFMLLADKNKLPGRFGYFAIAGVFCAFAVLSHPSSIFFVLFIFIYLLVRGILGRDLVSRNRKIFTAFAFLLPVVLLTFLWSYHISSLANRPVFVQGNGGFNFYLGNRSGATGACDISPGKEWFRIHSENALEAERTETGTDLLFIQKGFREILQDPAEAFLRTGRKFLYIFSSSELSTWSDITILKKSVFHKYFFDFFFLFLSLTAAMVIAARLKRRRFFHDMRYFLFLAVSSIAVQLFTVSSGRYRMSLLLPLAAVSSLFFAAPGRTLGKYYRVSAAFLLFLAIGLAGMILDSREREKDLKEYANYLLAEAHLKKGELRQCENVLLEEIREGKEKEKGKFSSLKRDLLAKVKIIQKDLAGAEKVLQSALKEDPEELALLMNYGTLMLDMGKYDRAKKMFEKASLLPADSKNMTDLEYNFALLAQRTGNDAEAERRYHSVLQMDPLHTKALNNLGVLLIKAGKASLAEPFLERACAMEPGKEEFFLNLAVARKIMGKHEEMVLACRKALLLNPRSKAAILLQESRK